MSFLLQYFIKPLLSIVGGVIIGNFLAFICDAIEKAIEKSKRNKIKKAIEKAKRNKRG